MGACAQVDGRWISSYFLLQFSTFEYNIDRDEYRVYRSWLSNVIFNYHYYIRRVD